MKFDPEFLEYGQLITDRWPEKFKKAYPRRIILPSQNYADPKTYGIPLTAVLHLAETNYCTRNPIVGGIDLCCKRLVELEVPTFFIHSEFMRALLATDLSPDFQLKYLKWPFDAMLFCLPLDVMKEIFPAPIPWIAIARIPAGEQNLGRDFKVSFPEDRVALHYPVFSDMKVCQDYGGMWPVSGELQTFIDSKPFLDDTFLLTMAEREAAGLVSLTPEQDKEITKKVTVLAILIILGMIARPAYIEMGQQLRKEKVVPNRPNKSYDALWGANVIGFKYQRVYEGGTKGTGTGGTRRFFKRRGHLRNQVYGKMYEVGRKLIPAQDRPHEVIWIDPISGKE